MARPYGIAPRDNDTQEQPVADDRLTWALVGLLFSMTLVGGMLIAYYGMQP